MDNKINFTGGFLICKPDKVKWENIQAVLPRRKCVFQKFNSEGDKFVAVKTHYDRDMLNMLLKKKVDFKFFPDINLKTQLDSENLEEAQRIISSQSNVVEGKSNLKSYLADMIAPKHFKFPKYKWKPDDHIGQTLKALGLSEKECKILYTETGAVKILDKRGKQTIALASPNSHLGYNYVLEFPKEKNGLLKRLVVDMNGEIADEFSYLQRDIFNKHFKRNLKIEKGRMKPKNL